MNFVKNKKIHLVLIVIFFIFFLLTGELIEIAKEQRIKENFTILKNEIKNCNLNSQAIDAYGNKIVITEVKTGCYEFRSIGPDHTIYTKDDIVVFGFCREAHP